MARDELQRVMLEHGVTQFSSAREWMHFYANLKSSTSNGFSRDTNAQREWILQASRRSVAARAEALQTGKSFLRMKVKFGTASGIPALRHIICRRLSRKFAAETLHAFGLGDAEELDILKRQFDEHFHRKKRSKFTLANAGSKAGSILVNIAKNTLISHIFMLQTAFSKGMQVASGYKTIRKRMKEMIRLAAEKAVEIHRIYFIPLIMGDLIELPPREEEPLLFVCYGCNNLIENPNSFSRCQQCHTSEAIFCSNCSHELEPGGQHMYTYHRSAWHRLPVSKIVVEHTDAFELDDMLSCSTCHTQKPRFPFFAKCMSATCPDSDQCIQCFFEDPPAHVQCSNRLPDFKLIKCSAPPIEKVVMGMDALSLKQAIPEVTRAAIRRSSTIVSKGDAPAKRSFGRSKSMATPRPAKRGFRRAATH